MENPPAPSLRASRAAGPRENLETLRVCQTGNAWRRRSDLPPQAAPVSGGTGNNRRPTCVPRFVQNNTRDGAAMDPNAETCATMAPAPAHRGRWPRVVRSAPARHSAMGFSHPPPRSARCKAIRPRPANPLPSRHCTGPHASRRHPQKSCPEANAVARVSCRNNRRATRYPLESLDGADENPGPHEPHSPRSRGRPPLPLHARAA